MNSIWNKNYSAFKTRFPQLASILPPPSAEMLSSPSFWNILPTKNGMITAEENGLRLHSAYNPEREASTGISIPEIKTKSTTVFYGFGLGYHVVQWAKIFSSPQRKSDEKKLVLIEPDYNHFYAAMTILDWTEIFKLPQLVLAISCPPESVLPLIENTKTINIGNTGVSDAFFFELPAFIAHDQEYFNTVKSIINRNKRKNEINNATLKKFGRLWCKNSIKNIEKMKELSPVSAYKKSAYKKAHDQRLSLGSLPFLIIGAGPSLESILPVLPELKKRTVIICVETALKSMIRAGVEPDFIIITDPQWWAYRHIAPLKAPDSILVTEISTYPAVFRFNCKEIILCSSQFPIGQYFQTKLGLNMGDLGTGGSVASSAWNMAHFFGATEIFTAGLDFAFPKNQTHIKGSDSEETQCSVSYRLNQLDNFATTTLFNANADMGKDYNGNPVVTDSRMKMFSWWFESRLANCPETKTYTLCPQGLNTPGITAFPVEKLLQYKDISKDKADLLNGGQKKPIITGDKVPAFKKLLKDFPSKDFLQQYPFLQEYI